MNSPEDAVVRMIHAVDGVLKTMLPCVEMDILPRAVLLALAELAMAQLDVVRSLGLDKVDVPPVALD